MRHETPRPEFPTHGRCLWLPRMICALVLAVASTHALPAAVESSSSSDRSLRGEPSIGSGMTATERFSVRAAFGAALRVVDRNPACAALFDDLAVDGMEALRRSRYRAVSSTKERGHCALGVAAVAEVGRDRILICWRFHHLTHRNRAATLIHEALHTAGLGEYPHDPDGMTPREITERVKRECGL